MAINANNEGPAREGLVRTEGSVALSPPVWTARPPPAASDDSIDLASLWATIKERWLMVMCVALLLTAAVMVHTALSYMEFKAVGRLYLGELDAKGKGGDLDVTGPASGDVASELEIIKSRSIVLEAIGRSGLNASIEPIAFTSPRFWQWLVSRRDPHLLEGASREVAVHHAAVPEQFRDGQRLLVQFFTPREYRIYDGDIELAKGVLDAPVTTALASFTLIAGSHGAPKPGARYALRIAPLQDAADGAISNLSLTVPKSGPNELVKVVTLEFTHRSPQYAARFLKQLMAAYLGERQSWKVADASAAESFVSDQLKGMRETLDATQQKLADYRSSTKLVVMDNEAKAMIEQMGKYEEQRVAARLQATALADIQRMLKQPNPPVEAYLLGESSDTVLEGLGRSLAKARQELTDLQERFNDTAPDVKSQKAQIASQLDTIRNYVANRHTRAQENVSALNGVIGQFEARLKTVPGAELGLAQLARESDVYSKLYSFLLERQQQAAIQKASTVSKNRVLDEPEPPRRESTPQLGLRLASGLLGLALGIFLVLLRRLFSSKLQSDSDVRSVTSGSPVLASIPRWAAAGVERRGLGDSAPAFKGIVADSMSPFFEAFRTLRTSIYHNGAVPAGQVVLVTSPTPGDGKTTSTLSLAAMLAADSKWVLVIDADLRKPSHHALSADQPRVGLGDILSGQCDFRDVVRPVSGPFGEFFSIPAGRSDDAELISSDRMRRFLSEARARYDYILIDGPSFPLVADPLVLAPLADAVLSVVRLGHTPRAVAAEHVRRVSMVAPHYGVVVNGTATLGRYGYAPAHASAPRRSAFARFRMKRGADSAT